MSIYEASITNPKKQLEFYRDLSEQLQQENEKLHHYKTLYKNLKRQKEELRSWLKEGFSYDKGVVDENFIEAIENVLEKLEE